MSNKALEALERTELYGASDIDTAVLNYADYLIIRAALSPLNGDAGEAIAKLKSITGGDSVAILESTIKGLREEVNTWQREFLGSQEVVDKLKEELAAECTLHEQTRKERDKLAELVAARNINFMPMDGEAFVIQTKQQALSWAKEGR